MSFMRDVTALVVDDDPGIRALYSRVLCDAGIKATAVTGGQEALQYVSEHDVSIVLLDSTMPIMSGSEVLRTLRGDVRTHKLPVIMVTGEGETAARVRGLEAGADGYIAKPVDNAELVAQVRAVLRGRSGEAEIRNIVESANDAYCAWDLSGLIIGWNASAASIFGWERSEILGRPFGDTLLVGADRAAHDATMQRFLQTGEAPLLGEWLEISGRHRDGTELTMEMTVWAVKTTGGPTFHALIRDLSGRRELERALSKNQVLPELIGRVPDVITMSDSSGLFYVSPTCRTLLGYEPEELIGAFRLDLVRPEDRRRLVAAYRRAFATDGDFLISCRIIAADGRELWTEAYGHASKRNSDGQITAMRTVWRDVSTRKAMEEERARTASALVAANAKLEETVVREHEIVEELRKLDRVKTDFVSTVSHELRTPLTSIMGYVEILIDDTTLDPEYGRALDVISRNAHRLLMLIEDLLTTTRIESDSFSVVTVPSKLGPIVDSAVRALSPAAQKGGIEVDVNLPEDLPEVLADREHVDRVLLNLLSNAIKFTPPLGHILIRATVSEDAGEHLVTVSVRDDGMGISEEEQLTLFRRFARAHTANERAIKGCGLGLFIVKRIVELHGGEVTLYSSPGIGTEVRFTLQQAPRNSQIIATVNT